MQKKCKTILEEKFPDLTIREKGNQLLFNKPTFTLDDLDALSYAQDMCADLCIKRSGTGLVIILSF